MSRIEIAPGEFVDVDQVVEVAAIESRVGLVDGSRREVTIPGAMDRIKDAFRATGFHGPARPPLPRPAPH